MVLRPAATSIRRKRQQTQHLEPAFQHSYFQPSETHRRSQSSRMVATSAWAFGLRRWNSWSYHSLLELHYWLRNEMHQRRLAGLQPHVRKNDQLVGQHPWLLAQRDQHLENAKNGKTRNLDWPHLSSSLPCDEPRWNHHRHWRRRRNPPILEYLPEEGKVGQRQIHSQHWIYLPKVIHDF